MGLIFNISEFPNVRLHKDSSWNLMMDVLSLVGFWIYAVAIFLGAGVESALTFWSRSYVEIYLEDLPRAGAIAVVVFSGGMAIGRLLSAKLSNMIGPKILIVGSAGLGLVVTSFVPFVTSLPAFYTLLLLAGITTACFWPTILAVAKDSMKADSTILMVLLAVVGVAGFGLIPWMMGIVGESIDLKAGFLLIPACFIGLILMLKQMWLKVN